MQFNLIWSLKGNNSNPFKANPKQSKIGNDPNKWFEFEINQNDFKLFELNWLNPKPTQAEDTLLQSSNTKLPPREKIVLLNK